MFESIKINLDVNQEHKYILEIIISYLAGLSIFIIPLSLILCIKNIKCKCKKQNVQETENNIVEII